MVSEIVDDEVRVYEDVIRKMFSFVGEGVDDFEASSINLSGKSNVDTNEWQNQVEIIFTPDAMGSISMQTWNSVQKLLSNLAANKQITYAKIDASRRMVTMDFDDSYEMGVY